MILTFTIAFVVFLSNIPFGFWRKSVKKFSVKWFVSIHVPVLISILLRNLADIELHVATVLLFVFVFFMGQFTGKYVYVWYHSKKRIISVNE